MNDLILTSQNLPDLTVAQIAALPPHRLQELDVFLTDTASQIKLAREKLATALEQRYGEQSRSARLLAGKDFGVVHVSDGELRITVDLPKKVAWDQDKLAEISLHIDAAGGDVDEYIDVEFSVSESRFNNWPAVLKEQFAAARTVKPGKPTFRLALASEGGA